MYFCFFTNRTKDDREFEIVHEETGTIMFTCRIVSSTSLGNRKPQPKGVLLVPQAQAVSFASPEGALEALNSMGRLTCAVLAFPNPSLRFTSLDVAKSQLSDGLCASPLASAVRNVSYLISAYDLEKWLLICFLNFGLTNL